MSYLVEQLPYSDLVSRRSAQLPHCAAMAMFLSRCIETGGESGVFSYAVFTLETQKVARSVIQGGRPATLHYGRDVVLGRAATILV